MKVSYSFPVVESWPSGHTGFRPHDEKPSGDRRFHFSLPLPEAWSRLGEAGEAPTRENPLTFLARYVPAEEPGAEVVVTGRLLGREAAPADLIQPDLERSGEEILQHREVDSPDGRSIDVLTRRRTERGGLVLRRTAVKRANRMLVLHAAATEETYARWADRFAVVAAGLRFLEPGTWHCAEALSTLARKEPSDFLLFYPESWRLAEPVSARPDVLSARLVSGSRDRVTGLLDLAVMSRAAQPGPRAVVDVYLAGLKGAGLEVPPMQLRQLPPPTAYREAWEAVGEADSKDGRAEIRLRVGCRPDAWFCFALTGPTRASAPNVWAVNRRALDVAFGLVATPDVPMQGWIAEAIEKSASPREAGRPG